MVGRGGRRAILVVSFGVMLACATVAGIDDLVIGECKGGGNCLPDAAEEDRSVVDTDTGVLPADDSGVPCPGKPLPPAVRVGTPGNTFCIDSTEVTNGQYQEFLDAKVPIASQPAICAWNGSFAPNPTEAGASVAVAGVDWCDALAYCTWAGKYLCGRFEGGRKVGPVTIESSSDFRAHQWMNACSADARLRYPYGAVHERGRCNLADFDAGRPVAVGTAPACQGGYAGLYDLVGNVWEWYDGPCRPDGGLDVDGGDGGHQQDNCWLKGGSYQNNGPAFDCRFDRENVRRDLRDPAVGFRCCSD